MNVAKGSLDDISQDYRHHNFDLWRLRFNFAANNKARTNLKDRAMKKLLLLSAAFLALYAQAQETALCFRSTEGNYWKLSTVTLQDKIDGTAQVTINSDSTRQTFKGWGTCFNELPWDAYNLLSTTQKTLFAKRLFNPDGDLRLTVGRIPVGASDYARNWYSSDETEGNVPDFNMEHFNITRDLETVIPSIKVAQAERPDMTFWASPWSPPQWMKTNKHYAQRVTSTNGCPFGVPPYTNDQFIDSTKYYDAYCLYFDKFINAYKEQDIPITTLAYQNEAYSNTPYPGCSWTAATTGKFLGKYLGPYMREHQPDVKLIVGTMNTNHRDVFDTILKSDGVSDYCSIIGFQWEGGQVISGINSDYPAYEMWQTESECGSGTFDWNAAAHTFQLINHYLANNVTTYTYWNAILKDNGVSNWGWVQNALVQVNSATNRPRYTAEYYAFKHYSHLIPAGSQILAVDEANLVLSAKTPDGNIVVVVGNDGTDDKTITMDIDGKYLVATVPLKSFNSYVIGTDDNKKTVLASEARGLANIETASLTADQLTALNSALTANSYTDLLAAVEDVEKPVATAKYKYTPLADVSTAEKYYLYDVTASMFVNQKSGDTRTDVSATAATPLTVTQNGDYYRLQKGSDGQYFKIGYYQGQYVWCDGTTSNPIDWTLTANADSTFRVSMASDIVAKDNAVAAGTYYLSGGNATTDSAAAHVYAFVQVPSVKGTATDDISSDEQYYLYDNTAGQYVNLSTNASDATRPSAGSDPTMALTITKSGDYYELHCTQGYVKIGTYQGQYVWLNGATGGAIDWTFTANGDGTYKVSMAQDIVARDAAVAAGTYYLTGANATTTEADAHSYKIVSTADYLTSAVQAIPSEEIDMAKVGITNTTNGHWSGDHLDWMDVGTVATYYLHADNASDYRLSFQASSLKAKGATVTAEFIDDNNKAVYNHDFAISNSGNWNTFNNYYAYIPELPAGDYTLRLTFDAEAKSVDNIEGTCNMKGLTIDAPEEVVLNEDDTTAPGANVYVDVVLNRSLKDGHWNTFCIPFTMAKPEGWQVYELTRADGSSLTFAESKDDSIKAGKPYILKPAADLTYISVKGVTIDPTASSSITAGDYTMTGNYAATTVPQGAYFINENTFYLADTDGVALKGFRAYITTNGTNPAKQMRIVIDGETTGISEVTSEEGRVKNQNAATYNLAGQRVGHGYKGIVVSDGRKFINK